MTRTVRFTATAALLLLLSLAAACGGGGDGEDQATATPDAPEAASDAELELRIEGDFVAPDAHAFTYEFVFAGSSTTEEAVIIGEAAWLREGTGEWEETARDDQDVQRIVSLSSADPDFLVEQDFVSDIQALDGEPDSINGVETTRYVIPRGMVSGLGLFGGALLVPLLES